MSSIWWDEIARLLSVLEQIQADMEQLLSAKSRMLSASSARRKPGANREAVDEAKTMGELVELESELVQRLQAFTGDRAACLARARRDGLPGESLHALAGAIGGPQQAAALERIHLAQVRSARLRRQSWSHWIIAHQCYHHYTEMLELIANGGRKAPTYSNSPTATSTGRKSVLLNADV